jgi:hypothetical protein
LKVNGSDYMKHTCTKWIGVAVACVLAAGIATPALGAQAEINAQMKLLTGDNVDARQKARTALTEMRAGAVKPLLTAVGNANRSVGKAAEMALFDITVRAGRFGAEPERAAVSKALAEELSNASLPQQTRAYICRLLGYVGREEVVPALVMAMGAKDIGEMARWALSGNPTSAALDALQEALPSADLSLRIGLINAIGARAERRSLGVLAAELNRSDASPRSRRSAASPIPRV